MSATLTAALAVPVLALLYAPMRSPSLVLVAIGAAWACFVGLVAAGALWRLAPSSLGWTVASGAVACECARLLFALGYRRVAARLAAAAVDGSAADGSAAHGALLLKDASSSLAGGVGWAAMHAVVVQGSAIANPALGGGDAACDGLSAGAVSTAHALAFVGLDVALTVVAFHATRAGGGKAAAGAGFLVAAHAGASALTASLACATSIAAVAAVAAASGLAAWALGRPRR